MTWAVPVSLLLHVAFAAVLAAQLAGRPVVPGEPAIEVELLSPEAFDAAVAPRSAPGDEAPSPPESPPKPVPDEPRPAPPDAMIRPTRMLSATALADPRSREARDALPFLDDTERMVQLCDVEAMEQVHAWRPDLRPEKVIAYALAELAVRGDALRAGGAALRSGNSWYALAFDCALSPAHDAVVSFAFQLGDPVPEAEWEARNLPVAP